MIYDVKKVAEKTYVLNDAIQVTIIEEAGSEELQLDIDFDDKILTEQEAVEIAQKFVQEAIESFKKIQGE
jgi:hypothetical protein